MLPVRWILPIVGALFALALVPLAFSPQDSMRSTSRLLSARNLGRLSFRRACSVVMMMTYGSPHPDAGDVTGNVQPTAPVRAEQVTKPPSKRITHLQRRSRKVLHQRAKKEARVANVFGAQQARRTAKPDMKFNAVY
jgi:hypothetical protein